MKSLISVLLLFLLLLGCKDKSAIEPITDHASVNSWILEEMKYWYYWNERIPKTPELSQKPADFFQSILYKYDATTRPDGDRFSWIQESAEELTSSLSGETKGSGMEYKLYYYPTGTTNVMGVVIYTIPGSPAARAGIKRGDLFTAVNQEKLTATNYAKLLNSKETKTFAFAQLNASKELIDNGIQKELIPEVVQEDPVYYDTVFVSNTRKVGYVVYHQFNPGPNGVSKDLYDQKMEAVFDRFKKASINELIVDLRYNSGGYVSSAAVLGSLIGKVNSNDIFYYKEYNAKVTPDLEKKYGKSFFYQKFSSKSQNVGGGLNKVYFLTSTTTASASELLINGLKPFMEVVLVGGKTVGKNMGSITISDSKKKIKWGLQPLVTKSLNGLKQSDYNTGFEPQYAVNEGVELYPYGDKRDRLLGLAMDLIVGGQVSRSAAAHRNAQHSVGEEISSSLPAKTGGANMFFDDLK
jgi:carboxyl-terminal processing protease